MTDSVEATRATVHIGSFPFDGYPVKAIPLPLASAFWMYRSFVLKDVQAMRWVMTLTRSKDIRATLRGAKLTL